MTYSLNSRQAYTQMLIFQFHQSFFCENTIWEKEDGLQIWMEDWRLSLSFATYLVCGLEWEWDISPLLLCCLCFLKKKKTKKKDGKNSCLRGAYEAGEDNILMAILTKQSPDCSDVCLFVFLGEMRKTATFFYLPTWNKKWRDDSLKDYRKFWLMRKTWQSSDADRYKPEDCKSA